MKQLKFSKIKSITSNDDLNEVFDVQHELEFPKFLDDHPNLIVDNCLISNCGRHAGGVVILDDAPRQLPLIASKGEPQTPWTEGVAGKYLEPLGVIKYDLLGLETMRLIERTIELIITQKFGKLLKLEFDDQAYEVYENQEILLSNGEYVMAKDLTEEHDVKLPIEVKKT